MTLLHEVCRTAGFMGLGEETVGKLLKVDGLGVNKEEEVGGGGTTASFLD